MPKQPPRVVGQGIGSGAIEGTVLDYAAACQKSGALPELGIVVCRGGRGPRWAPDLPNVGSASCASSSSLPDLFSAGQHNLLVIH
jgi:hypothetical protein